MTSDEKIYFNGIDGETGNYVLSPRKPDAMHSLLAAFVDEGAPRRLGHGTDPDDLAQAGWAVIWPEGGHEARREALRPLLDHRRAQAGDHFHEFEAFDDENALEFLERQGAGPGPVNPQKVPFHLLIAATPEEIPFRLQSELGCSHAVGRLDFDHLEDDTTYAERLVAFEESTAASPRHAAFFGVEHRDDPATWNAAEHLTQGLERSMARAHRDWDVSTILRHAARKEALSQLLHGGRHPSLLFTASHGVRYLKTSQKQATHQGALLCADYPGKKIWDGRPILDEQLFAAQDLASDADLSGLVSCHFACYSAGTPRFDHYTASEPQELAERPFVAPLAKALLSRGAMAVIGHVDLTFEESFLWYQAGPQLTAFESLLSAIMDGHTLGYAMDFLACRYAQLAVGVAADVRQALRDGASPDGLRSLRNWATYEDARNFILLGDPAARLQV